MGHLLYLMFRCDGDVMESLEILWELNTPLLSLLSSPPGRGVVMRRSCGFRRCRNTLFDGLELELVASVV